MEFARGEKEEEADLGQEREEYSYSHDVVIASDSPLHVQPVRGGFPGERLPPLPPPHQGRDS